MGTKKAKKPLLVAISDVHFSIKTLEYASKALQLAINKSNELKVPLVIAGDLNDTKAILRAETVKSIIDILKTSKQIVYVLVGNHDRINEKGLEHSLNFLEQLEQCVCIDSYLDTEHFFAISYQNNANALKEIIQKVPNGKLIVMHQGVQGAFMGHYVQDRTSIKPEEFTNKVFSGHYHRHQTLGNVTYIGNPYSLSYSESEDPEKGFLVIYDDYSYENIPTNLSIHNVVTLTSKQFLESNIEEYIHPKADTYIKFVISGPSDELRSCAEVLKKTSYNAKEIRTELIATDEIKYDSENIEKNAILANDELMDKIIDQQDLPQETKDSLKRFWREL